MGNREFAARGKTYAMMPLEIVWTPDKKRNYHRERRAIARALRICQSCNAEKAKAGRSKCHGCLVASAAQMAHKRAALTIAA